MEKVNFTKTTKEKKWFAIYTRPRWEKKVHQLLQLQGITCFCPLRKVKNKWADRIKVVEMPLFSSYVFVHITPKEELKVRMTLGVMNFVYFMGKPAQIREEVIDSISFFLKQYPDAEVIGMQQMEVGNRVRIKEGLMNQRSGEIVKIQGADVLVVIDTLNCAMITKIPLKSLEHIN